VPSADTASTTSLKLMDAEPPLIEVGVRRQGKDESDERCPDSNRGTPECQ
jgi:hypothetical protein